MHGFFFDGKKDKHTKVMVYDEETGRNHPREGEEAHITVTWEGLGLGKYLFHFTPDKPKGKEKPAEMISKGIYSRFEQLRTSC